VVARSFACLGAVNSRSHEEYILPSSTRSDPYRVPSASSTGSQNSRSEICFHEKINTGCREQEVCWLRWDWEVEVPELDATVFLIPCERGKNVEERLVVINAITKSVIESERGKHGKYVFTYKGKPVTKIYDSA